MNTVQWLMPSYYDNIANIAFLLFLQSFFFHLKKDVIIFLFCAVKLCHSPHLDHTLLIGLEHEPVVNVYDAHLVLIMSVQFSSICSWCM